MNAERIGSILGGVFAISGFIPYIYGIFTKQVKPSKVSWIIWVALDGLTLAGMLATHTVNGQLLGAVLGSIAIILITLRTGDNSWTRKEKLYLLGGVAGLAVWRATSNPLHAIMISLAVVALGAVPTVEKAWKDPWDESLSAWLCFWLSGIPVMLTLPRWTVATALQPVVWTAINTTMLIVLTKRRREVSRA